MPEICLPNLKETLEFISLWLISYVGNMEVVSREIMYEIFSWWISFLVAIQTLNKLVSTLKVPGNIRTFLGMNWMNMNFPQYTLSRKPKGDRQKQRIPPHGTVILYHWKQIDKFHLTHLLSVCLTVTKMRRTQRPKRFSWTQTWNLSKVLH